MKCRLPPLAHPTVVLLLIHSASQQVVMIDGREIGDGKKIGPVTRQIQNAYKVLTAGQGVPIPRITEV